MTLLFYLAKGEIFVAGDNERLTQSEILNLIYTYLECNESYFAAAKRLGKGYSDAKVKRYVEKYSELVEKCRTKKREAVDEALTRAFDQVGAEAEEIVISAFREIKEKLPKANVRDLIGLVKVFSDMRFTCKQQSDGADSLNKICEAIRGATGVDNGK